MTPLIVLPDFGSNDEVTLIDFEYPLRWGDLCRYWEVVLATAVGCRASSIHYQPWRSDTMMFFFEGRERYDMIPPGRDISRRVAAVAGAMICDSRLGRFLRRWFGWPTHAAGRVRFVDRMGQSEWAGVTWSVGSLVGVDWYRLEQVEAVDGRTEHPGVDLSPQSPPR